MIKFYDTCSLLDLQDKAFETNEKFFISNITLVELEQIKTSATKDEDTKYKARRLTHSLAEHNDKYNTLIYNVDKYDVHIKELGLIQNNDSRIIATAYDLMLSGKEILFITSDLNCYEIAYSLNLDTLFLPKTGSDKYTGYKVVDVDDAELALFYEQTLSAKDNKFNLCTNQYLLLNYNGKITDMYKWDGNQYQIVPFRKFESKMFGKITPKGNDSYQQIAMDSLETNQITMLRGKAGTGKSLLSFGFMFSLLEQNKIDKIIVFCNTVATKGSAKLGYYPGSRTEKLLDSQIGNLLISKLGDRIAVERLIDDGQLILLPMSDIRGYDTTGMNAAIYISEAQNLDKELMKLALSRVGEDSICIIDGDSDTQVDLGIYAGANNGMRRVSKIFRGASFYGEVRRKWRWVNTIVHCFWTDRSIC